jgi:translocation and assembly module TamB
MAEVEQQPPVPEEPQRKRGVLRNILWTVLLLLISLGVVLGYMFSTDRGSKFLLDRVLERQQIIRYEYEGGNLLKGIALKNVWVALESVDVKIQHANITLGWRAILNKEIHLSQADVSNLSIRLKGESSDEPFQYPDIKLPFVLRVDHADVDHLEIVTKGKTEVDFYHILLNDALWTGTELKFKDTAMDMGYLNVRNATGGIDFHGKYPLNVNADVNLPSLHSIGVHDIKVIGRGSLETIYAGVAAQTPDMLTGWAVIQPMHLDVPMYGKLKFNNYQLPLLTEQELKIKKGEVDFKGNSHGFNLGLNTDLSGKNIPQGQYRSHMYTDFVDGLTIHDLTGQVMKGVLNLAGRVDWSEDVSWNAKGRLDGINPQDKLIPQVVKDFLPNSLDAAIASTGSLKAGTHLTAQVDFDRAESWSVKMDQNEAKKETEITPLLLDVQWKNIDRAMPYIGWLKSESGQAKLTLVEGQQDILVQTQVSQYQDTLLPTGQYQAQLKLKDDVLNIPSFSYKNAEGGLNAKATLHLPTEKRQLKWNAELNVQNFNPQLVTSTAPVNLVNGRFTGEGFARPNQQIILLKNIDLVGQMADSKESVRLTGQSTAVLQFFDEKQGGGFRSYAVSYDGGLNASQLAASKGVLKARISGTPNYLKIQELLHDGAAGRIKASGSVNLVKGIVWDINAALIRFKPQYFVSSVKGELSGVVRSQGTWSDRLKKVSIQQLNLAGMLNQKPVRGSGNLSLLIDQHSQGFMPSQFEANQLFLAYASNQIQATGNAQNIQLKINAPQLNELYNGLRGRAYGYLNIQARPRLQATANLAVDNFGFNQLVSVRKLRIQGELPTSENTPSMLVARMEALRSGDREIKQSEISLSGTRRAHVLKVQAENRLSKLYVQLAGGFNAQNNWMGQIQKGDFDSLRTHLVQRQNAAVIYNTAASDLYIGAHCWMSQQSEICADQPLRINKNGGSVSLITRNVDLNDFAAFMPTGLSITGHVNGYAKAAWRAGQRPKIDARLVTREGLVGLTNEEDNEISSSLRYDQIALVIKSVINGLQVRLDVNTPEIGRGYANVVIDPYGANMPMRGEVAFDQVQMKVLKPFIADVRKLEGTLSYAGKISGTLKDPLMDGDIRLKDGAISMISLPVNLNNIQVYAAIRGDNAAINGAFNAGRGVGQLTGNINWKNQPRIQLKLKGENLLVRQAPLITAVVTPEINLLVYPMQKHLTVNGKVSVPRALISMPESTATVVNVSPDVRVVYQGQDQLALLKAARPWDIKADIEVSLGDKVIFQGFNSRIPLAGRVYLTQSGLETAMRANGAIGVRERVNIEAYGQSLELRRAIARFNGALTNPTLDIDTVKSVQGSVVGVRINGTASNPAIQVYNDAGLSEQEALNALITGRINEGSSGLSQTEGFRSDVNNTIAAAGISMGLGGTRALTNQIGQTFGLSGLALDAQGTGDDTQVSLTGYITPDLFIRYGVGVFTPVNKLTLRYQMNKRLYLEASQSLERAIDVFYNWRF